MNWTQPADLRAQVQKLWDRGELLAGWVTGAQMFPRRLSLKGPGSVEWVAQFDQARDWIAELRALPHVRLDMREVRHRVLGANLLPEAVWLDSLDDALRLIGRQADAGRFGRILSMTQERQPQLLPWLAKRPLKALELAADWPRLLDFVAWRQAHPSPGVYLRQIDLPGLHSKFIESRRGVLLELLDLALPGEEIVANAEGIGGFARRYGFLDKPARIRFRMLDPELSLLPGVGLADITLDADSFARLTRPCEQVFITENEINFLALPPLAKSMVIFGAGYGFDELARTDWLHQCHIRYWGDIDSHGFAILDQLRSHFSHVQSFLMDRDTLFACREQWGVEDSPTRRDLAHLTPGEAALYDDLRDNRIQPNLRLEQERIGFDRVRAALG